MPLLNESNRLFLINFTWDNLTLFILYCVCWRFSKRHCKILKIISFVKCALYLFWKGRSYFKMRNLSPVLSLGFLYSTSGLLYRMDKKSEILTFIGITSVEQFFLESGIATTWDNCECVCIHNLMVTVKYILQGAFCTFSKCCLYSHSLQSILVEIQFCKVFYTIHEILFPY